MIGCQIHLSVAFMAPEWELIWRLWRSRVCRAAAGANRCSSCLMSYKLEMHQVNTVPLARQFDREQGHCKVTPRSPCRRLKI